MTWSVILSKHAIKDLKKLKRSWIAPSARILLELLAEDPFATSPRYEKLIGNLRGFYSRRINIQHRLVYSVDMEHRIVHVLRMWSHYE